VALSRSDQQAVGPSRELDLASDPSLIEKGFGNSRARAFPIDRILALKIAMALLLADPKAARRRRSVPFGRT
jgi:hypothetical protein